MAPQLHYAILALVLVFHLPFHLRLLIPFLRLTGFWCILVWPSDLNPSNGFVYWTIEEPFLCANTWWGIVFFWLNFSVKNSSKSDVRLHAWLKSVKEIPTITMKTLWYHWNLVIEEYMMSLKAKDRRSLPCRTESESSLQRILYRRLRLVKAFREKN